MINKEFRKSEAVSYGWEAMKRNLGFFILFQIILLFLCTILQWILATAKNLGFPAGLANLLRLAAIFTVCMVCVWTALRAHDAKAHDYEDLFSSGRRVLNYLAVEFIYACIVAAGLILLVVPAFIWGIQFGFARFAVLDEGLGPIEALRRSSQLTQHGRSNLFLFGLTLLGINVLGFLALGIGLLVTLPTTFVAMAWVFREMQQLTTHSNSIKSPSSLME